MGAPANHSRIKKVLSEGSNSDNVFGLFCSFRLGLINWVRVLDHEGREDPNTTISRPSSARQRTPFFNGVSLAGR